MVRNVLLRPLFTALLELLRPFELLRTPFLSFTIKVIKSRTDQLEIKNVTHIASAIISLFIIGLVLTADMYKSNDKPHRRD